MWFNRIANLQSLETDLKRIGCTQIETFVCVNGDRAVYVVRAISSIDEGDLERRYGVFTKPTGFQSSSTPLKPSAHEIAAVIDFFEIDEDSETLEDGPIYHIFVPIFVPLTPLVPLSSDETSNCKVCDGTGVADSGAPKPNGGFYTVPCECQTLAGESEVQG